MRRKIFAVVISVIFALSSYGALPEGWTGSDVGAPSTAGSSCELDGTWTVDGAGDGIHGPDDQFHFVYREVYGDTEIIARVSSLENTAAGAKAGVMLRKALTADSQYTFQCLAADSTAKYQRRSADGNYNLTLSLDDCPAPRWIRLVREGDRFTGYVSSDGVTWTQVGSRTADMPKTLYLGLAVGSDLESELCTAVFDNVFIAAALPRPVISPSGGVFSDSLDVELSTEISGADIRYTTDGTEPEQTSSLYSGAITVSSATTIKARVFKDGFIASRSEGARFENGGYISGLRARYYDWATGDDLPDFSTLVPVNTTVAPLLNHPIYNETLTSKWGTSSEKAAALYTGKLYVPDTGDYNLYLDSTNDSALYIDGALAIDNVNQNDYNLAEGSAVVSLSEGMHDIRVEYQTEKRLGLILSWSKPGNGSKKELVKSGYLYTLDSDNDGLPDDYEIDTQGDLATLDGTGDMDLDGYSDGEEFSKYRSFPGDSGSVPFSAGSTPTLGSGLLVRYYTGLWDLLPLFELYGHFGTETAGEVNYPLTSGNFAGSGLDEQVGAVFEGYIDIPSDGHYLFYVQRDNDYRLSVDGEILLERNSQFSPDFGTHSGGIPLKAGKHPIKLQYLHEYGDAALILEWEGKLFDRQLVPSSILYHDTDAYQVSAVSDDTDLDNISDADETATGTSSTDWDSDGDGLSDYEEVMIYGTNPNNADSDGDGVDDWTEVKLAFSDPNSADFNGAMTDLQTLAGASGSVTVGEWDTNGESIYALTRNGAVEYTLSLVSRGSYLVEIAGTQYNSRSLTENFDLDIHIDGSYCGSSRITAPYGAEGTASFYLPELDAGNHTLKVTWNNIKSGTFLQINSVKLQSSDGPDNDQNGIADWIDNRTENTSEVTVPANSRTSPVCVEGENAANWDLITISGYYTPEGETPVDPVLMRAPENRWYANVPISPAAASTLSFSFQNGANEVQHSVTWTATNVIQEDGPIQIRLGDSLLLTGYPEGADAGSVEITVEGNVYNNNLSGDPVEYKFENTGQITLSATYTPDGGADPVSGNITVDVVSSSFSMDPACFIGCEQPWENPDLDDDAVIEHDWFLHLYQQPLAGGGRFFTIYTDRNLDAWVIARLGENGPILDNARVDSLELYSTADEGYLKRLEHYEDGTYLVEAFVALDEVPADINMTISIFKAGAMFEDGTVEKTITASDFDENGLYRFRFITPDTKSTACFKLKFTQNGALLY